MKTEAKVAKRPIPYMYECYNISCFTTNPLSEMHNMMARLVNCFIKALNDNTILPRFVLLVPEVDLLSYFSRNGMAAEKEFEHVCKIGLKWIIEQLDRAIEIKKEELKKRHVGSITSNEPKIIWVSTINRPEDLPIEKSSKDTYNAILENLIFDRNGHFILKVDQKLNDGEYFDALNSLNARGQKRFWQSIDDSLERFDYRRITLRPERDPRFYQVRQQSQQQGREQQRNNINNQQSKSGTNQTRPKFFKFKHNKKAKFNKNFNYY